MTYDLKKRIGHKDGWIALYSDGTPCNSSWCNTRAEARRWRANYACANMRLVRARAITVWRKS